MGNAQSRSDAAADAYLGGDHARLGAAARAALRRGVQCNMKVVVRGARGTGKSVLVARVRAAAESPGAPVRALSEKAAYVPTRQIQVATAAWTCARSPGVAAKLEVWDVVDCAAADKRPVAPPKDASPGTQFSGWSLGRGGTKGRVAAADAQSVDVYRGAAGALLVLDATRPETAEYVLGAADGVPPGLPVLVVATHTDLLACGWDAELDGLRARLHASRGADTLHVVAGSLVADAPRLVSAVLRFLELPFLRLQRGVLSARIAHTDAQYRAAAAALSGSGASESTHAAQGAEWRPDESWKRAEDSQAAAFLAPVAQWRTD